MVANEVRPYGRGTGVPNPIDVHVGKRIRMRRQLLGLNQEALASVLGLTFQQVQKYENGSNRVSASRLSTIGDFLRVPISFFFDEIAPPSSAEEETARERMERTETLDLIRFYYKIPEAKVRLQFFEMIKAVAEMSKGLSNVGGGAARKRKRAGA